VKANTTTGLVSLADRVTEPLLPVKPSWQEAPDRTTHDYEGGFKEARREKTNSSFVMNSRNAGRPSSVAFLARSMAGAISTPSSPSSEDVEQEILHRVAVIIAPS
jgi:hypothetical protein